MGWHPVCLGKLIELRGSFRSITCIRSVVGRWVWAGSLGRHPRDPHGGSQHLGEPLAACHLRVLSLVKTDLAQVE